MRKFGTKSNVMDVDVRADETALDIERGKLFPKCLVTSDAHSLYIMHVPLDLVLGLNDGLPHECNEADFSLVASYPCACNTHMLLFVESPWVYSKLVSGRALWRATC